MRFEIFATFKSKIIGEDKNACLPAIFNHDVSCAWQIDFASDDYVLQYKS